MLIQATADSIPLADGSVDCVVTSPPYWGLRDYGVPGQLGLEPTPEEYVARMVAVFREVRRVLKASGVCWLNLGDGYSGSWSGHSMRPEGGQQRDGEPGFQSLDSRYPARQPNVPGLKPKDLIGIPWRVALALQADGWWLRSDVIWAKPNPMPESVRDRPTRAHEYLFLLTKSARYWWDGDAVREKHRRLWDKSNGGSISTGRMVRAGGAMGDMTTHPNGYPLPNPLGRNIRTVWTIATQPYPGAHYATFPEEIPRRCIAAGCPPGGVVLDPFVGSGTVVRVARSLGRSGIGLDVSHAYLVEQARVRVKTTQGFSW